MAKSKNTRKSRKRLKLSARSRKKSAGQPLPDFRSMERLLAAQADQAHASPENQQRAEELIFQAWETPDPRQNEE